MPGSVAYFAVTFIALFAAHSFGDHWVQRHYEAKAKGAPTATGRAMCARHVVTLTMTKLGALILAYTATGAWPAAWVVLGALALDAASHYWADRAAFHPDKKTPVTLERLAMAVRRDDGEFYRMGRGTVDAEGNPAPTLGTGAYALDQSFHIACLFLASLLVAWLG